MFALVYTRSTLLKPDTSTQPQTTTDTHTHTPSHKTLCPPFNLLRVKGQTGSGRGRDIYEVEIFVQQSIPRGDTEQHSLDAE